MKCPFRVLAAIVVVTCITASFAPAKGQYGAVQGRRKPSSSETQQQTPAPVSSMTIWQARKTVVAGLQQHANTSIVLAPPSRIKIDGEAIEFYATVNPEPDLCSSPGNWCEVSCLKSGSPCRAGLRTIGTFSVDPKSWGNYGYGLLIDGRVPFVDGRGWSWFINPDENARVWQILRWPTREEAQAFADAVNRLRSAARGEDLGADRAAWLSFQQQAAAWRALPTKPAIGPETDRQWMLAENALKEKDFDSAGEHYQAALAAEPTWPAGWFDLAMIYGELQYYSYAADAMKHYLELVPGAPDAKQAQEQLIIWEDKAGH